MRGGVIMLLPHVMFVEQVSCRRRCWVWPRWPSRSAGWIPRSRIRPAAFCRSSCCRRCCLFEVEWCYAVCVTHRRISPLPRPVFCGRSSSTTSGQPTVDDAGLHGRRSMGGQGDMPPYFLKWRRPLVFSRRGRHF